MIQFADGAVAATRPNPTDDDRLADEIAELAAHLHAATYRLLMLLRGVRRLSYSKVRALTRVATADNEARLLEFARAGTASQVERLVRAWRRVDRQEEAEEERLRHERRYVSLYPDEDGSWTLRGRLDPEVGALLEKALEWASEQVHGKRPPSETSVGQRRADALGLVAEQALGDVSAETPSTPRRAVAKQADRFQVVLHVEQADEGHAVLASSGRRVPAETSRRLACDASVVAMTHDVEGRVLDVGRKRRTIPPAIRRALEHRDRKCRFPGCESRYCDAHHVEHWADGGGTKLDNLLLLCRVHHRAVHEGGHSVEVDEAGDVRFRTPWGWLMPEVPPAPRIGAGADEAVDAVIRLRSANESAGLGIAAWTRTPRGHGERLDLDWPIYVLRGGHPA